MKEFKLKILENKLIGKNIGKMVLPFKEKVEAGQFFMLDGGKELFLHRPLSTGEIKEDSISFYYLIKGKGTRNLEKMEVGEEIKLFGPLGKSFPKKEGKIALVGGGIGIAPLIALSHQLKEAPNIYLGFLDEPYGLEDFRGNEINISTDSGKVGHKGFVTEIINPEEYDTIYACGPDGMLKALKEKVGNKAELIISLEAHMACGVGICVGCTIETKDGFKRVCKEGPVFNGEEVIL